MITKSDLIHNYSGIEFAEAISLPSGIVLNMTIPEYIGFCKRHDARILFYSYKYYDKDKYLITEEDIDDVTSNRQEREFCKRWADSYNESINNQVFSRPYELTIGCSIDSNFVCYHESDLWLPDDFQSGSLALMHFLDSHEDELDELFEADSEAELDLNDELRQVLLSDSDFRYSTTISSRKQYVREFLIKKENKKYLGLVRKARQPWEKEDQFRDIVNRIYEGYRNRCKALKLHVGDPLPEDD